MEKIFVIKDKTGRSVHLSKERFKHILKHSKMSNQIENIKLVIENPDTIKYFIEDEQVRYFYKAFKQNDPSERYLLVSVKYLNGEGFVITAFFTNKITGLKWNIT